LAEARTVLVLFSRARVSSFSHSEWESLSRRSARRLVPVRVDDVDLVIAIGPTVFVDLWMVPEVDWGRCLIDHLFPPRRDDRTVSFPGLPRDRPRALTQGLRRDATPISNLVAARSPLFVGGDDLLDQLVTSLNVSEDTAPLSMALIGREGLGKTT